MGRCISQISLRRSEKTTSSGLAPAGIRRKDSPTAVAILKRLPAIGWLGNSTIALLVGVGAAVALTGAVGGTLIPQIGAFGRLDGGVGQQIAIAFFTAVTLLSFQFIGRKNEEGEWSQPVWFKGLTHLGRGVLMITFGALFAGVLNTGIILLSERIAYFLNEFWQLLT